MECFEDFWREMAIGSVDLDEGSKESVIALGIGS